MGRKAKASDLGRALTRKQQKQKSQNRNALNTSNAEIAAAVGRHTEKGDTSRNNLVSVLEANDLDELMANAKLANQSFTAERYAQPLSSQSVIVIPDNIDHEKTRKVKKELNETKLRIPRRPEWTSDMDFQTLMKNEDMEFLKWRRSIAEIENDSLLTIHTLTPFEKNLDVWRQLWRVVERSDIVCQIVDARDPNLYICHDLIRFVVNEMNRKHIIIMNKSDLLSSHMLNQWYTYYSNLNIEVIFFSAFKSSIGEENHDERILNPQQLIEQLEKTVPCNPNPRQDGRVVIGMCGYPNVGKSSTINVLLEAVAAITNVSVTTSNDDEVDSKDNNDGDDDGDDEKSNKTDEDDGKSRSVSTGTQEESKKNQPSTSSAALKRVGVSATPGKTKHFQTLPLTDKVMLCDCPGLVFPNFAASKAELICAGVLSIDQMRGDYVTPVNLIADRIPAAKLSAVYGIKFEIDQYEKGGEFVSSTTLLDVHARARGFMTDHGRPDQSRSARAILKDFVSGKLVYAHAPEGYGVGEAGVGAAVFAKKGKLVREREQAVKDERIATLEMTHDERKAKAAAADLLIDDDVNNGGNNAMINRGGNVRAMISRKKKQGGKDDRRNKQEFVRVQRSYDSTNA